MHPGPRQFQIVRLGHWQQRLQLRQRRLPRERLLSRLILLGFLARSRFNRSGNGLRHRLAGGPSPGFSRAPRSGHARVAIHAVRLGHHTRGLVRPPGVRASLFVEQRRITHHGSRGHGDLQPGRFANLSPSQVGQGPHHPLPTFTSLVGQTNAQRSAAHQHSLDPRDRLLHRSLVGVNPRDQVVGRFDFREVRRSPPALPIRIPSPSHPLRKSIDPRVGQVAPVPRAENGIGGREVTLGELIRLPLRIVVGNPVMDLVLQLQ